MAVIESIQSEQAARQTEKAAARVEARTEQREANIKLLEEPGGIARVNSPERIAARIDRLSKHWSRALRPTEAREVPLEDPNQVLAAALSRGNAWGEQPQGDLLQQAGDALELIIGTPDFVGINYLETGVAASRAVGRVNIFEGRTPRGFGTGSFVAPAVLLTNHHVLPNAETAASSTIELDFEDGPDGQPRQPHRLPLAPGRLFAADEELDFALVAVDASPEALAKYGYNPLIGAEGKLVIGEFVTIIQHPLGERKQVALRENRIVDFTENLVYHDADTEHGSSGSLVFNDQWEPVALHHKSTKVSEEVKKGGVVNEGIRISRIVAHLKGLSFEGEAKTLIEPVLNPVTDRPTAPIGVGPEAMPVVEAGGLEGVSIDPDYSNREGYDESFLGAGALSVPLPELSDELAAEAATMADTAKSDGKPAHVLPYHHFSVVLSKERKLAFFTAVNIDGATERRLKRDSDSWSLDPRIPADVQTGEPVYKDNKLDRGHLVRRLDPCWGSSEAVAKGGNDDTFHFTNCAPQHEKFNRNATTWAGIEDHILDHADNEDFKVNVFTGPVLADDDRAYRGVKMPRQFWKVVTMAKNPGGLSATAYLLSQEELIDDLKEVAPIPGEEEFAFGAFKTFQVPLSEIEKLTGISFGSLSEHDPLATRDEAAMAPRELVHESEAIL
ncbi:MAG TPA: DNA/RNA non-specific endonuclease [Solirubrobacterales bacterium]|nr:DNA/RNA non-specific endonuclease [Solirubrobacterales bacterium]